MCAQSIIWKTVCKLRLAGAPLDRAAGAAFCESDPASSSDREGDEKAETLQHAEFSSWFSCVHYMQAAKSLAEESFII